MNSKDLMKEDHNSHEEIMSKYEELKASFEKIKEESEHDKKLAAANAINAQKQNARAVAQARQYAISSFANQMIQVLDSITLALDSATKEDNEIVQGLEMTINIFKKNLEEQGITEIKADGEKFDPEVHTAVSTEKTNDHPENTVIKTLYKGYKIHERVLRPASVIVAKSAD